MAGTTNTGRGTAAGEDSALDYRLGIIGAGGIGTIHADTSSRAGISLAAVCDADAGRAKAMADAHGAAHVFSDPSALFASKTVDAVVVAVPNDLHVPLAIAALESGHDVLLEKPMSTTVAGCAPLVAAASKTDRLVQLNFVTRQSAAVRAMRPIIASGALGEIYHVSACMVRQRGVPGLGRWFTSKQRSGGGVLIDLGVHIVDLVMHLTGNTTPVRASATCRCMFAKNIGEYKFDEMWAGPPDPGGVCDVEDSAHGTVHFADGMTADVHVAWASNVAAGVLPEGVVLFGDRASCHIDPWNGVARLMEGRAAHVHESRIPVESMNVWDDAWLDQHRAFADIVTNRTPPSATIQHGVTAQRVLEAMYRSSDANSTLMDV
ncbi:MAG: Gfo/Idh/MocA family oxidoreductase [Phycisphaerales bacterium]|nr:Gfo/Idh/MocA family oxidoreductase [Phycisphaerales bacterium]